MTHPDYEEIYAAYSMASPAPGSSVSNQGAAESTHDYKIDTKSRNVYKWLDWIVMDELELGFCEKEFTRENSTLEKISAKTLKKYMFRLVAAVEKKITAMAAAASKYALVFDGWTRDGALFIGKLFD